MTADALPLSIAIGPANEHDSRRLIPLLADLRPQPREIYADKAYATFIVRTYLARRHVRAQIPSRRRKRPRARPFCVDPASYYRHRSAVERFFSVLKGGFRRLAIRYERLAATFLALIWIACFIIHWRVSQ